MSDCITEVTFLLFTSLYNPLQSIYMYGYDVAYSTLCGYQISTLIGQVVLACLPASTFGQKVMFLILP